MSEPSKVVRAMEAFSLGQSVRLTMTDGRELEYGPDRSGMCATMLINHPDAVKHVLGDVPVEVRSGRRVPRVFRAAAQRASAGGGAAPLDTVIAALEGTGNPVRQRGRAMAGEVPVPRRQVACIAVGRRGRGRDGARPLLLRLRRGGRPWRGRPGAVGAGRQGAALEAANARLEERARAKSLVSTVDRFVEPNLRVPAKKTARAIPRTPVTGGGATTLHGVFLVVVGVGQLALAAVLLVAPRRRLLLAGAAGTLAVIAIWATSRTVGLPIPPQPWVPEPVGLADVAATAPEAVSVVMLWYLVGRGPRVPLPRRVRALVVRAVAAALAVGLVTIAGEDGAASDMPSALDVGPAKPGRPSTSVTDLVATPGPQPVRSLTLTAQVAQIDGHDAWTYDGTIPGPEIGVRQGDRVRVTLVNRVPEATTIHWHGIRVPNAEDGVADVYRSEFLCRRWSWASYQ